MDSKIYTAFDDSSDPAKNILIACAREGYDAHNNGEEWLVSAKDPLVAATIERAKAAG